MSRATPAGHFQKAIDLWMSYYASAESAARSSRHLPADEGENYVKPLKPTGTVASTLVHVVGEVSGLGLDPSVSKVAREEASWCHDAELKPCECSTCLGYRR